jgi:hypothetical protein
MSHVHFINGQLESADRYQAFLDQARAVRLAEKKERTRKKAGTRSFETAIDADEEDEETPEDSGGEPREEAGQEPAEEPGRSPESSAGAPEGFGQHYA